MNVNQSKARAGGHIIAGNLNIHYNLNPVLVDEKIQQDLQLLRARRHFVEFDRVSEARKFAERCFNGELAAGSKELRSLALAWCARILSDEEDLSEAENILAIAKQLEQVPETLIAEAFITAKKGDKLKALRILADIGTAFAKSAALSIVSQQDGKAKALEWFKSTGLYPNSFDSEGKNLLLAILLEQEDWDGAFEVAANCSEEECTLAPLLKLNLAFAELLHVVPEEYRHSVCVQLPFEMASFDLASGVEALAYQEKAQQLFEASRKFFAELCLPKAAELAQD